MALDNKTVDAFMHAYLDGHLSPDARKKIQDYLHNHPDKRSEFQQYQKLNSYLHGAFDALASIPVPDKLHEIIFGESTIITLESANNEIDTLKDSMSPPIVSSGIKKSPRRLESPSLEQPPSTPSDERKSASSSKTIFHPNVNFYTSLFVLSCSAIFLLGLVIGYLYPKANEDSTLSTSEFIEYLVIDAHQTFSRESQHGVEMPATELVNMRRWLSSKLAVESAPADLEKFSFKLIGGRLLPSSGKDAAFYMYKNESDVRLTLYIRPQTIVFEAIKPTCHRRPNNLFVCAWQGEKLAYFLVSELTKNEMDILAEHAAEQLIQ